MPGGEREEAMLRAAGQAFASHAFTAQRLRAGILAFLTYAEEHSGADESLATWWLGHPQQPKEQIAQVLMDIAHSALGARRFG